MKIKSKFKDYYDFVGHKYGGGDPNVVYPRTRITVNHQPLIIAEYKVQDLPNHRNYYNDLPGVNFKMLAIAGKYFMLICENTHEYDQKWEVWNDVKHAKYNFKNISKRSVNVFDNELVSLSKEVGHPVFIYYHHFDSKVGRCLAVESACPILQDYGIDKVIPPEQMYQDLAYFIGNTMKDSPDTTPPVQIDNKDRIVQHGFDLKQSFRHRK
jgi:hypothetical protein